MLTSLAPARRRLVLGLLGLATLAVVAGLGAAAVSALGSGSGGVSPVAQDAQPPVLLVPGYGGATGGLDVLAAALRRTGRNVTVVHLAGDGTGDLQEQAAMLQRAVEADRERCRSTSSATRRAVSLRACGQRPTTVVRSPGAS